MYWFARPPYLRWAAASLLVITAAVAEFRPAATVAHPFAAVDLEPGRPVSPGDVEWRAVPIGLLPLPELEGAATLRAVPAGEPLLPSSLGPEEASLPEGWWAIPLSLPERAAAGDAVRLLVIDPFTGGTTALPGLVVEPGGRSDLLALTPGLVAVPGEAAGLVAAASTEGRVVVALGR